MSQMNNIIDPKICTVHAQVGAIWLDVMAEVPFYGLATDGPPGIEHHGSGYGLEG